MDYSVSINNFSIYRQYSKIRNCKPNTLKVVLKETKQKLGNMRFAYCEQLSNFLLLWH